MSTTSLAAFLDLAADHRVVPVVRTLLADDETPLSLYRKLAGGRPSTFLLESAPNGQSWSRWSFIGVGAPSALTVRDGEATWLGTVPAHAPVGGDPFAALAATLDLLKTDPIAGLPPLHGGMVGFWTYDAVRRFERLPEHTVDDQGLPELLMLLATDIAAFDHHTGTVTLIANAVNWDDTPDRAEQAYADAVGRLDAMTAALAEPAASRVATLTAVDGANLDPHDPGTGITAQRTEAEYRAIVDELVGEIAAGEAFQVVPSLRFEVPTDVDPIDIYRILRTTNPSPYMYLLTLPLPDGNPVSIVGSSPEALVTVSGRTATTHPIAGTRWRGDTDAEDELLAKDLSNDEKENAEHLMLVDLGRNDLGRVCAPGSVVVSDYRRLERYSHVMHLVSTVTGQLSDGNTAVDAARACFPAGTLSGAPKVRAMELIEQHELTRRGIYGGVVGYFDFTGDADLAIAIRTAVIRDGLARVQAGGGVVADSDGGYEFREATNKAKAVLAAIATAATIRPFAPDRADA